MSLPKLTNNLKIQIMLIKKKVWKCKNCYRNVLNNLSMVIQIITKKNLVARNHCSRIINAPLMPYWMGKD